MSEQPGRWPGASFYMPAEASLFHGGKKKTWCLLLHAQASISIYLGMTVLIYVNPCDVARTFCLGPYSMDMTIFAPAAEAAGGGGQAGAEAGAYTRPPLSST